MYVAESDVRDKDTIDEDSTATDSDDSSTLQSDVRDEDTIDEDSTATDSDDSSMLQRAMSGIKIPSMKIPQPLIVMIVICCRERCPG